HILETLESISDNKTAVKKFGIDFAVNVCEEIIRSGLCPGFHFYTLNNESSTITVLKKLGLWKRSIPKALPWRVIPSSKRYKERVRPIFWSNRIRSYLYRTSDWLIYPENKWNDYAPQVYKEVDDYFYKYLDNYDSEEELKNLWGNELNSLNDVYDVFGHYFSGKENKNGFKVTKTAWTQNKFDNSDKLTTFSEQEFLTINFQLNLNGVDSSDEKVGWGPKGGLIYRKAYLEFFTSRQNAMILKDLLLKYKQVNYNIINSDETENYTNCDEDKAIAIDWAAFPGEPIMQPTVADPISFKVWKNEAFSLWNEWAKLYEEESKSKRLLEYISNDYFLVYLIDNNFPNECCFWKLLEEVHLISKYSEQLSI
ncbi:methylenetetrahydrofolate reductase-like isoform X5, partial [Leptotrombidium deliense]